MDVSIVMRLGMLRFLNACLPDNTTVTNISMTYHYHDTLLSAKLITMC